MNEDESQPQPPDGPGMPPVPTNDVNGAEVPSRARTRVRGPLVVIGAVVGVLALGGAGLAFWVLSGTGEMLMNTVPADADAVMTLYLDPAAAQKVNLRRMASRFPEIGDEEEVRAKVDELIDEAFADVGLTHEDLDWVGSQVLFWVDFREGEPFGAMAVNVTDQGAAAEASGRVRDAMTGDGSTVSEREHEGTDVTVVDGQGAWAIQSDVLLVGSEEGAVIAGLDALAGLEPSLDEQAGFAETTSSLPPDRLMLAYVDAEALIEAIAQDPAVAPGMLPTTAGQYGITISAEPDGLAFDAVTIADVSAMDPELVAALDAPAQLNAALDAVVANAMFVAGAANVDVVARSGIDALAEQDPEMAGRLEELGVTGEGGLLDLLSGDFALAIQPATEGGEPVHGVMALGIDDGPSVEQAIRRLLRTVAPDVEAEPLLSSGDDVAVYGLRGVPVPIAWAVSEDMVFIGTSAFEVGASIQAAADGTGIAQTDRFANAVSLVDTSDGVFFLDVRAVTDLLREILPPDEVDAFDEEVAPYVDPIDVIVAGGSGDARQQSSRLLIVIP